MNLYQRSNISGTKGSIHQYLFHPEREGIPCILTPFTVTQSDFSLGFHKIPFREDSRATRHNISYFSVQMKCNVTFFSTLFLGSYQVVVLL